MKSLSVPAHTLWPYVKISNLTLMYILPLTLKDYIDLNHITTQNTRFHEIHVHIKYGSDPLRDEEIRAT